MKAGTNIVVCNNGERIKAVVTKANEKSYIIKRSDDNRTACISKKVFDDNVTYSPVLGHNIQAPKWVTWIWKTPNLK